jgi:hypothetical protein
MTHHKQVGESCQNINFAAVLGYAMQSGFLEAELALDHPKWVLNFYSDVSLGRLDQVDHSPVGRIG